jgi:2,3-oxidosqualene cyclase
MRQSVWPEQFDAFTYRDAAVTGSGPAPDLSTDTSTVVTASDCVERSIVGLRALQHPDGAFEGEVIWCPMILAQYVIMCRIIGHEIDASQRDGMIMHLRNTRRADGGWGLHPESNSYVYVTTLVYVALRILGQAADAPLTEAARRWLQSQPDGVLAIPTWGKFWLALAGLYKFEGMNPFLPELFLLPRWAPVHPNHLYCHTRYIYLAISYLYGARFRGDLGPITAELRKELFPEPYESIPFAAHRHQVADTDLYVRPGGALRNAWNVMAAYERLRERLPPLQALRRRALARCLQRIRFEQCASNFQALSPVNGILNTLSLWAHDPRDPMVAQSLKGVESWRWSDERDGVRFAGARSTSWDTAFSMLAVLAGPAAPRDRQIVTRAYDFLVRAQESGELSGGHHETRDAIDGGWCFSDGRHRWPVSDCTAEALSAILAAQAVGLIESPKLQRGRLEAAVTFILDRQNPDGGFGTYERRRGWRVLEQLNPSEMFGNCMTELSYIECTGSAVIALCRVREQNDGWLDERMNQAIAKACAFLRQRQRDDGAWLGFWGINFTYATWFAVTALRAAGAAPDDPALARAAVWLVARQKPDGGWGEHYSSCLRNTYVEHPDSQVTMTSWALLALLETADAGSDAVRRGIGWLCRSQHSDGSWPSGAVNGVFFGSAMLMYQLYPTYFPIWALNRYLAAAAHGE